MKKLSPEAQAVAKAALYVSSFDPEDHPNQAQEIAAAALRALTRTCLVEEAEMCGWFCGAIRTEDILDIAAELEGH